MTPSHYPEKKFNLSRHLNSIFSDFAYNVKETPIIEDQDDEETLNDQYMGNGISPKLENIPPLQFNYPLTTKIEECDYQSDTENEGSASLNRRYAQQYFDDDEDSSVSGRYQKLQRYNLAKGISLMPDSQEDNKHRQNTPLVKAQQRGLESQNLEPDV